MTIIAALHEPSVGTWIGSDRLSVARNRIAPFAREKWSIAGSHAVAFAGAGRANDLMRRWVRETNFATFADPLDVATALRDALKADEWGALKNSGDPLSFDVEALYASQRGAWDIDAGFSINGVDAGVLVARGSGIEYAYGAAHALRGRPAETVLRAAIDAAIAHDTGCGGEPFIHLLKP